MIDNPAEAYNTDMDIKIRNVLLNLRNIRIKIQQMNSSLRASDMLPKKLSAYCLWQS